jgi:Flp pilus assembly protein TadD
MNTSDKENVRRKEAQAREAVVWQFLDRNDTKQALAACQRLNEEFPDFAPGWRTASHLALKIRNAPLALQAIEKALEIEPDSTTWLIQKALCLSNLGRNEELSDLVGALEGQEMSSAWECSTLALLLTRLERREEAIRFYEQAARLKPGQSQHYYNIAILQRSLGDTGEAEQNFNRAIDLNPTDYEAYKVRSELRTQTADNNHVRQLEKLLKRGVDDPRGRVQVCYALAKELEDMEESKRSFHYLKLGADTRRGYMQYDVQRDIDTMQAIAGSYLPELFEGRIEGDSSTEPIFILGMPRTGTTLVERILASHTDVYSAGELNNFTAQLMAQIGKHADRKPKDRDEAVALSTSIDFAALGKAYVDSTRPFTGHTPRFIDKLPLNYLYAGLIHLALPNAKIINLKRHPMDTCYAIYKQLFVDAYPFSYKLEELGRYFAAYHRLMEHWHQVIPGVIHTVEYENLVGDVEGKTRRLLKCCELDWQPQCLKFYESREASTTASSTQVRQPVYASSVAKWRLYEEQLVPLAKVLESSGVSLDT